MKDSVANYLKKCREEKGMSLREVSELSDISHTYIRSIENGIYNPSFNKVMKLLSVYGISPSDFLKKTGYLPNNSKYLKEEVMVKVPILKVGDLQKRDDISDIALIHSENYIRVEFKGGNLFALEVEDNTMSPEFIEGDVVVICPDVRYESGDYVVVRHDDKVFLRELRIYKSIMVLRALDSKVSDIELSRSRKNLILGKIVEKRKRY